MTSTFKPFATIAVAVAALLTGAVAAQASSDCGFVPKAEWRSLEDAVAVVKGRGYDVREAEIDSGCYEIKAIGKEGQRVKFYLNPKSLDVVRDERR